MKKGYKKKTILIIEDDVEIQTFSSKVLELEGYGTLVASSGEEGLLLLRENKADLLLLDLRLPGQSGWDVLKEIRNDPEICTIPIIVFTASTAILQRMRAIDMGATSYLVKPLSAAQLKNAIAHHL